MTESPASPIDAPSPRAARNRRVVLGLIALTLACYWPVGTFEFINYDDPRYVPSNRVINKGLTWEGVKYAFTSAEVGYRHPLSWLSHMLDVSLFGLNAGGHHIVSMIIHAVNVVLLWWVLLRLTGASWPSAWVAAILAVHPTHLESVAWVAERKDTLSLMFLLLTVWAYIAYAERPSIKRYLLVFFGLVAALLSKPMMVTAPALLLLLDIWPLRRITPERGFGKSLVRPLLEKLPLLVLSAICTYAAMYDTATVKTLIPLDYYPLSFRIQTTVIGYLRYVGKLLWPTNLSIFYPYPDQWPVPQFVLCLIGLILISAVAVWQARKRPYLLVGWLFFAIALSPVIGMIPGGEASLGDRYTYAPFIGLCIALAWLARDLGRKYRQQPAVIGLGAVSVVACAALTAVGVWRWQNSLAVMGHALKVTERNWLAHINYGVALRAAGDSQKASRHFAEALRINPGSNRARVNYAEHLIDILELEAASLLVVAALQADPEFDLAWAVSGRYWAARGHHGRAIEHFQKALTLGPHSDETNHLLAHSLFSLGRIDESERHLRIALELNPDLAEVHHRLGLIEIRRGNLDGAIQAFQAALQMNPDLGVALLDYGILLAGVGRLHEALPQLQRGIEKLPQNKPAGRSLAEITIGRILEELGKPMEGAKHFLKALDYAEQGVAARPHDAAAHYQLAGTLRAIGQHQRALESAARSMELATQRNNHYLIAQLRARFPGLQPTTHPAMPLTTP